MTLARRDALISEIRTTMANATESLIVSLTAELQLTATGEESLAFCDIVLDLLLSDLTVDLAAAIVEAHK